PSCASWWPTSSGRSSLFPHHVSKYLVHAIVLGELGMERRGKRRTLADGDDPTRAGLGRQNLDAWPDLLHPGSPDKDRAERRRSGGADVDAAYERVGLAAERVPPDRHVVRAERLLVAGPLQQPAGQHDHPGT